MEGFAGLGQGHPISVPVEQSQPEVAFQVLDRGEDRRMASSQFERACLEAAFGHHGVEAKQLVKRQTVHFSASSTKFPGIL